LLQDEGLVKGRQFKNRNYVGDPINAVRIFNDKEVDELIILDISATSQHRPPNFDLIADIASEAFMPFGYGGGINSVDQIEKIFKIGVEKAIINTAAFYHPELVSNASRLAGSQSIVVSIDVRRTMMGGYEVYIENGTKRTKHQVVEYARKMEELGAGELILCSIDREGTAKGYDLKLVDSVSSAVDIPVVAQGGASKLQDFADVINETSASAIAAGDMFVYHGKHKAVLITYPEYAELEKLLN